MKKFRFLALVVIAVLVAAFAVSAFAEGEPPVLGAGDPAMQAAEPAKETKGFVWAALAICIALILPGVGSALSVGMAGRAAAGVSAEDPEKGGACLVFELLPATQGLYGFVVAIFIAMGCGIVGGGDFFALSAEKGLSYLYGALPIGIVGIVSAYFQARVCCAGIGIVAKQGNGGMGITYAIMVELYAILALIISILMVTGV